MAEVFIMRGLLLNAVRDVMPGILRPVALDALAVVTRAPPLCEGVQ